MLPYNCKICSKFMINLYVKYFIIIQHYSLLDRKINIKYRSINYNINNICIINYRYMVNYTTYYIIL